jgi:hypothetical protein
MNATDSKIPDLILKNALLNVIVIALLFLASLFFVTRVKIDSSPDVFYNKTNPSYIAFEKWKEQFGSDDLIFVVFSDDQLFSAENLTLIDKLTRKFNALDHVNNVQSLTNINDIIGYQNDFIIEELVEEIPRDPRAMAELRERAVKNPLYVKNLISPDGRTTALLVELENEASDNDTYKKEVIENVQAILARHLPPGKEYHLSGTVVTGYYFARYMARDLKIFIPVMFLIIAMLLFLCFRDVKIVLLPLSTIAITVSATMAILHLLGYSINNITTIIPPILMAIAIADSIHLISETLQHKARDPAAGQPDMPLIKTLRHLFFPCLLTTLTTSIGFFSLSVSRVPPVKTLGIIVGIGVFIALLVTFIFLPSVIKLFRILSARRYRYQRQDTGRGRWRAVAARAFTRVGQFNEKYRYVILGVTGLLMVLAVVGVTRIRVETRVLEFFDKQSPLYRSTLYVEENLSGVHTLNISLKSRQEDFFKHPAALKQIEKITDYLYTFPEIDKVITINDYIKEIHKSFHNEDPAYYAIPGSRQLVAQYILLYGADDLDDYVNSRWDWTTLRVRIKEHSSLKLERIIQDIQGELNDYGATFDDISVVGETVLEAESNSQVTEGQIKSLGLAMIVIFAMMFVVFRSISVGLVSIVPNLLPILFNFGIMGWMGIRLDSATSMIAAVGIGIVVDDTIHYLHSYGQAVKNTGNYTQAMYNSLAEKGRPIFLTSVILFFGFGIIALSQFIPTRYFGLLSAMLMINALVADLIVLPCVLLTMKPRFRNK